MRIVAVFLALFPAFLFGKVALAEPQVGDYQKVTHVWIDSDGVEVHTSSAEIVRTMRDINGSEYFVVRFLECKDNVCDEAEDEIQVADLKEEARENQELIANCETKGGIRETLIISEGQSLPSCKMSRRVPGNSSETWYANIPFFIARDIHYEESVVTIMKLSEFRFGQPQSRLTRINKSN